MAAGAKQIVLEDFLVRGWNDSMYFCEKYTVFVYVIDEDRYQ